MNQNPFKSGYFYAAFFITLFAIVALAWLIALILGDAILIFLIMLVGCIPCGIAGIVTWAIIRNKNRNVALGILFGSLAPFVAASVLAGSCMFLMRF